jgi:hypothetical protein
LIASHHHISLFDVIAQSGVVVVPVAVCFFHNINVQLKYGLLFEYCAKSTLASRLLTAVEPCSHENP